MGTLMVLMLVQKPQSQLLRPGRIIYLLKKKPTLIQNYEKLLINGDI